MILSPQLGFLTYLHLCLYFAQDNHLHLVQHFQSFLPQDYHCPHFHQNHFAFVNSVVLNLL